MLETRFSGVTLDGVQAVASLFGVPAERQAYAPPDDSDGVWAVHHRGEPGNLRVLLWPSLNRIDVTCGPHMWIARGVDELEILEDVELIARFGDGGVLTAAVSGQVMMVAPRIVSAQATPSSLGNR